MTGPNFPPVAPEAPDLPDDGPVLLDFSGTRRALVPPARSSTEAEPMEEAPPSDDDLAAAIAEKLAATSFGARSRLFAGPQEAWRAALEGIRQHQRNVGRPKRHRLILCLGPEPDAAPPPGLAADPDIDLLRTDDAEAIVGAITPRTAALFIAPVRIGHGIDILPGHLLADLRMAADEYGLVLVFDESAAGIGRTGMAWAHEWRGVTPDLMVVEGLAGPDPLTALVATEKVGRALPPAPAGLDGTALAAADTTLAVLAAEGFDAKVQSRAWQLEDRLSMLAWRRRDLFSGICGTGLLQGLVTVEDAEPLRARLEAEGLLTRACGTVLGLFPPLEVTEAEIDDAASRLAAVCEQFSPAPA